MSPHAIAPDDVVRTNGRAPVPRVLAVCEDPGLIGAPFYVMERIDGEVVSDTAPMARYEAGSGRSMGDIRWYEAMALSKIVVFMEGNHRRALAGSVDDPYLTAFGESIAELADRADARTRA